jgi:predicted amidohydrolase
VKVCLIQINNSSNWQGNCKLIEEMIWQASSDKPDLIVLPENCFLMPKNGAQLKEFALSSAPKQCLNLVQSLAKKYNSAIVIGSLAYQIKKETKPRNRLFYIDKTGKVQAYYDKIHLYDAFLSKKEIYCESNHFSHGKLVKVASTELGKIGLSICYDLRFPELYLKMLKKNVEIILVPSAFTYTTGQKHWHVLLTARAIETGSFVLAPALWGDHDNGRKTYGHSLIISPDGLVLAEGSKNSNQVISATINTNESQECKNRLGLKKRRITKI